MTNPYSELIEKIDESTNRFGQYMQDRDYYYLRLERVKISLLALFLVSAWLMFFLLWIPSQPRPAEEPVPVAPHAPEPPYEILERGHITRFV